MNMRTRLLVAYLIFFTSAQAMRQNIERIIIKESQLKAISFNKDASVPHITVWVHGSSTTLGKIFHDCPQGLTHISKSTLKGYIRQSAETLCKEDPRRFHMDYFYSFGWPGRLSFEEREKQANILYLELKKIVTSVTQLTGKKPIVQIITHSHGGNLVLNIAKIKHAKDTQFVVDDLILLACPVQKATSPLVKDSIFKRVYNLYSQVDLLQVADPQGLYKATSQSAQQEKSPIFSERIFEPQDNLAQAYIRFKRRSLSHLDFILPHIVRNIPAILAELDLKLIEPKTSNKPTIYSLRIRG